MRCQPFERPFPFLPVEDGLYIIRGPRQVGKSTWLKSILSHNAKSKKCFYLSCEEVENFKGLLEILRLIRGCDLILLDEVSFVDDWTRALKHSIDSGWTKMMIVTGSHAYDLKLGADRMPGRFDGGGEFTLLPMDFDEFCKARAAAGWTFQNVDIDSGAFRRRKDRKFYFTDPLLYWLAESLSGKSFVQDYERKVAEMVANEHLARRYPRVGYHSKKR